jgi:hypothetical protein
MDDLDGVAVDFNLVAGRSVHMAAVIAGIVFAAGIVAMVVAAFGAITTTSRTADSTAAITTAASSAAGSAAAIAAGVSTPIAAATAITVGVGAGWNDLGGAVDRQMIGRDGQHQRRRSPQGEPTQPVQGQVAHPDPRAELEQRALKSNHIAALSFCLGIGFSQNRFPLLASSRNRNCRQEEEHSWIGTLAKAAHDPYLACWDLFATGIGPRSQRQDPGERAEQQARPERGSSSGMGKGEGQINLKRLRGAVASAPSWKARSKALELRQRQQNHAARQLPLSTPQPGPQKNTPAQRRGQK